MGRVPAVWLVLGGIVSVQLGAAVAKDLFTEISPTAMVWLRLTTSAVVLLVLVRPRLRGRTRADWAVVLAYGVAMLSMNWAIYLSFARIPLGVAVAIEFLGPLLLAVAMSRRARDLVWVALAGVGVALLGVERADLDPVGVGFALLAGAAWAAYILLSARTGRRWEGLTGLAGASLVGAVVLAGPAVASAGSDLLDWRIIGLGVLIGVLSSVIPYSCELIALRVLPERVFSVLMSLEPAAAALAAVVVLQEFLTPWQVVAVACVVAASIGATRSAAPVREVHP
ncbi:EamA family transporter [Nocardioides massiliensis]|uniref:Inner membrane transporter RhtA n=1 Tax=Nocardioides massiliensis TaxID=1325935 RepID=A0ABT9NVD2_9ACTN|nr:EamA family transporter [Nocardioides massiliensis]MDP9823775.1 inner membrane transporter RhtA [Nocardioides massiliensis]